MKKILYLLIRSVVKADRKYTLTLYLTRDIIRSQKHKKGANMVDFKGKKNPNYRTGLCVSGNDMKSLYNSWSGMKQRCLNPNNPKYARYGARGIKIHEDWLDINVFYKWAVENGWKKGMSIDRVDNDGDYCPRNCRWITVAENSRKKRTTKIDMITAQEIRSRIKEDWYKLAEEYGCTYGNIWFIMNNFTHLPDGECTKKLKKKTK